MPDLAVRNMPAELHRALKQAAARNHRSLNGEILARLEASVRPAGEEVETILRRIGDRADRVSAVCVDEALLRDLKDAGRP